MNNIDYHERERLDAEYDMLCEALDFWRPAKIERDKNNEPEQRQIWPEDLDGRGYNLRDWI